MSSDDADLDALARSHLVLKLAAEAGERVKGLGVPFASPYGQGTIPIVIDRDGDDFGVYAEIGPWDRHKAERCLQWLALLRSSEREDLPIEIRSDGEVPQGIAFYSARTPRVLFELAGVANVTWAEPPGGAARNASTVRRLAEEFLELPLELALHSLERLDELVSRTLAAGGPERLIPSTVVLLGSYLGEVLLSAFPGRWLFGGATTGEIAIELSGRCGVARLNPFTRIEKIHREGLQHSTARLAQAVEHDLFGTPPGA